MKYLQTQDIIKYFVESLRKVFATNNTWVNEDQEVVEITEGNIPKIYDHQPREPEDYPIVVIVGAGGPLDHWALDDFVDNVWIVERLGSVPDAYEVLGNGYSQAFGVKVSDDLKLRSVGIALKYADKLNDDIAVSLSLASASAPGVTIASGKIAAFEDTDFVWKWVELEPQPTLIADQLYYIKLEASGSCVYYVERDTDPDIGLTLYPYWANQYNSGAWNISSSSTLFAVVQGPVNKRLGGGIQASLSLTVEAKDIHTMHSIEDIIFIYLNMFRHSNLKRSDAITYPPTINTELDDLSNMTEAGIRIMTISKTAESVRERGNDRIFSITFNIETYSFWYEDFEKDTLKKVFPTIENYN